MLRGTRLNYTANSMARNVAEIKGCQEIIQQIVEEEDSQK
jgi:hypothetical protein